MPAPSPDTPAAAMTAITAITVIGGDRRMIHAARRLADAGASVALLGQMPSLAAAYALPLAPTVSEALRGADAILLPLPASRDCVTVNCPSAPDLSLTLAEVAARMRENPRLMLFGGMMPATFLSELSTLPDFAARVFDYYTDEGLTLRNAYLTAEGALMLAGRESDHALRDASAVLFGYGRIGKLLARLLRAVGTEITVCARRRETLLWAETDGCRAIPLADALAPDGSCFPFASRPILFNTIPEPIFTPAFLERLPPDTLLFDLASPPYGVSDEDARRAAEQTNLRYIRAPGIPGQYAPRDAGFAIADCLLSHLP